MTGVAISFTKISRLSKEKILYFLQNYDIFLAAGFSFRKNTYLKENKYLSIIYG